MKMFGMDLVQNNLGYFGVRRCVNCKELKDVDLLEVKPTSRFLFLPIKRFEANRFLMCKSCGAILNISDELWRYYQKYEYRYTKDETDQVIGVLKNIEKELTKENVKIKTFDDTSQSSLDMIYNTLCQRFGNAQNVEEIISVYFNKE